MKTQKNNSLVLMRISILAVLFILASCNNKETSTETDSKIKVAKSSVRPPEVDIHTAMILNNLDALRQHIAAGSNLNEKDPFGGSSPLISAAVFGKDEAAKILIDAGADLNFQNNDGSTALHSSAFFCRPNIVKMLLDKRADKTIRNKFGATAYESVAAPFSTVKNSYDMIGTVLKPMGLTLDYAQIEKTRPEIAKMLK